MLKTIAVFFVVVIAAFLGMHRSMQNGSFLTYLDTHPDPVWTPRALYTVGQGYYLFQDLPEAATYFVRVEQKFPKSKQADDAAFLYIQVQDDQRAISRDDLIVAYEGYLERFPSGLHVEAANSRLSSFRTGAR